jgi:hypothetical protein
LTYDYDVKESSLAGAGELHKKEADIPTAGTTGAFPAFIPLRGWYRRDVTGVA